MSNTEAAAVGFAAENARPSSRSNTELTEEGDRQQPHLWSRANLIWFRVTFAIAALSLLRLVANMVPGLGRAEFLERRATLSISAFLLRTATASKSSIHDIIFSRFYTSNGLFVVADLLGFFVLASVATIVWTSLDRHRANYVTLNRYMRVCVRYVLAVGMVRYAFVKAIPNQFGFLTPGELLRPYGQLSRFWVLWNFMAVSSGYTVFTGLIELTGSALLFFRRTTLLGSLILSGALTYLVAIDLAYDVAAVEFAYTFLLVNMIVLAPYAGPLLDILLLRQRNELPHEPVPARERWYHSPAAKAGLLCALSIVSLRQAIVYRRSFFGAGHPVYGLFDVATFVRGGKPVTPAANDGFTWKRVASDGRYDSGGIAVQFANGDVRQFRLVDDTVHHVWTVRAMNSAPVAAVQYAIQPDGQVALDGQIGSESVHMVLRPLDVHKFFPLLKQ